MSIELMAEMAVNINLVAFPPSRAWWVSAEGHVFAIFHHQPRRRSGRPPVGLVIIIAFFPETVKQPAGPTKWIC